jgi:hypothetical protein
VPITGDALEHLARTRKLAELTSFEGVGVSELFADGELHPGYAFPLWHAAMALVARVAGTDTAVVIQIAPAILTPIALVIGFGMGTAVFGSRVAGFCTAVGQLGLFGLAETGIGAFAILTGPATVSLLALVPALVGLVFSFARWGRRSTLLTAGAAGLSLTVIHPTYTIYALMLLAAYCATRVLLRCGTAHEVRRVAMAGAAVALPAGLYVAWLAPIALRQPSVGATDAEVERQLGVYANQVERSGDLFAMAPEALTRLGPVSVIGLAGVVVALFAAQHRWGAYVLAAAGLVLLVTLVPPVFTAFSDVVSISQARRLVSFLPFALGFAGIAAIAARLTWLGVALALVVGAVVAQRYPGDFTYAMRLGGGPVWPVWAAVGAVVVALMILPWLRGRPRDGPDRRHEGWAAVIAVALVLPLAAVGLRELERSDEGPSRLSPALLRALREVPVGSVVFADDMTAYEAAAFAPVYVNTAEGGHVWDRRDERHDDAVRFFTPATPQDVRARLLDTYDADYVLARTGQARDNRLDETLVRIFADRRFVLYLIAQP